MVKEQNYRYSHSPFRLFLSTPSASLVPLSQGGQLASAVGGYTVGTLRAASAG